MRVQATDPTISLMIHILKAQLEVCHLQAIAFAKQYEASLTNEQKEEIAIRWDWAMKKMRTLKCEVELLEKLDHCSATLN
jgi:hypothetical protein